MKPAAERNRSSPEAVAIVEIDSGSSDSCRARASTSRSWRAKARVPAAARYSSGQASGPIPSSSSRMRTSCSGARSSRQGLSSCGQ